MTNPNYVDSTGLHTETVTDIITTLESGFRAIYGPNINLNSNSPDSQLINLFAQALIDNLDSIVQVYNSFDPDTAIGSVLDQRAAINGIVRRGASYTRTNVTLTVTQAVTITGLDTNPAAPFTVQDLTGNKFNLVTTTSFAAAGDYICEFQAAVAGQIETIPNSITTISTITAGISACNNPDNAIITGLNQETDIELRLRRSQSVSRPSTGYLPGMTADLLSIDNVVDVKVYENNSSATDVNGTPGHTIWCVVDGGTETDIATVIYNKRNAGCGMRGSVIHLVPQVNGIDLPVKFDRPVYQNLYIQLTVESLSPTHLIDSDFLKQTIYDQVVYTIYQPADYTAITTVVKNADKYAVVVSGGVSIDNITFSPFLYPSTLKNRFLLSISRISITVI